MTQGFLKADFVGSLSHILGQKQKVFIISTSGCYSRHDIERCETPGHPAANVNELKIQKGINT